MEEAELIPILATLGDDAKTAFIIYLICDYGTVLLLIGLVTWGIRAIWKIYKELLIE